MAVLRQEIDARIGAKDTRTVADVRVQDAAYRPEEVVRVGESTSWRNNLVESIAATAVRVGEKMVGVAQENAYLEGQAKAGRIAAEEELEGNWLTKDWAIAGYRDTMGKLALADSEAKMSVDMKELRTQGPAAMEEYLAKRRGELTPTFASLSREARANMFTQLLMSDRTAIVKHAGEHKAYILDTANKGIRSSVVTGLKSMYDLQTAAMLDKNKVADYHEAVKGFAAQTYTSIWANPMFKNEPELRGKMTAEALHLALQSDQVAAYEYFRDMPFKDVDGKPVSILAQLPEGEAIKLGNEYNAALKRNAHKREGALITQKAQYESALGAGTSTATWEEHSMLRDRLVAGGILNTPESVSSFDKAYFDSRGKNNDMVGLASAGMRGDSSYIANSGKTFGDAFDAQDKLWAKEASEGRPVPITAQIGALSTALTGNGVIEAGKRIGNRVNTSIMQLHRPDGTPDPQHQEIMAEFNKLYDAASPTAQLYIRSGLTEEAQARLLMLRSVQREGLDGTAAIAKVMQLEERMAKMTPQERAVASQVKQADIQREVDDFDSQGLFMAIKNKVFPTARNRAKAALQPDERLWGDNQLVPQFTEEVRSAIMMRAKEIQLARPDMDAASLVNKAATDVASRTIRVGAAPVILPDGVKVHTYFGVKESTPDELVTQAIGNLTKPSVSGNAISYRATPMGLHWKEYDSKGNPLEGRGGILDKSAVGPEVDRIMAKSTAREAEVHGPGKTVTQGTATVRYNGENSAGADPNWMFEFRSNLVKHEGVRNTKYDDLSGNINKATGKKVQTVGVGVSDTNPHFPKPGPLGFVSQEDIETSFRKASSDAASFGMRTMDRSGVKTKEAFLLFSEFAYQGVAGKKDTPTAFRDMVAAISAGDADAALAHLKNTQAYGYSKGARRENYEKLTLAAAKRGS